MNDSIHIGFSKGQSVDIRLLHTIVAAQTRYGKSTTIRTMMQHIPDEYKALCLDVKDPRDFEGAGTEIPIFIENKTDPLMLKQLLEQESHLWLRREFPELIDLCKEGDTFEKVYERVNKRMTEKVHPVVKDRLKVLQLLLRKLVENMAQTTLSDTLELPAKNNVMNLSKSPSEIKQLSVYSVVKRVLEKHENVVLVIDELPDFAPQQYSTPSKSIIGQAIRKGGAKGIWLWLSGQTMTGVDKQVLKQAMIWILGHQREINEAKRTLDQIPFKTGLDVKDIMTLPVGSFVVCTDEGAYITYVQPEGVDSETARKVSLGEVSVNEVIEMMKKGKEENDEMFKEKYEETKRKLEECEKEFARQLEHLVGKARVEAFAEAMKKVHEIEASSDYKAAEEMRQTIVQLKDEKATLETALKQLEPLKAFGAALQKLDAYLEIGVATPSANASEKVSLAIEHRGLDVKIHHGGNQELKFSTTTKEGQIMYCAVNELPKEGFSVSELNVKLAEHSWVVKPTTLATKLSIWVGEGLLIKVDKGYRLPKLVNLIIEDKK